jgi:hypothetical protein
VPARLNTTNLLFLVSTLSNRYLQALEMSKQATAYFSHLTMSIPARDCEQWERKISYAESCCHCDPTVMDILGVRDVSDDKVNPAVEPEAYTCTENWIQRAINIEEKQCGAFLRLESSC